MQMLIIAQSRQFHMKDVLSHPLGPLLWALAMAMGNFGKQIKQYLPVKKGNDKTFSELYYHWFFMNEL